MLCFTPARRRARSRSLLFVPLPPTRGPSTPSWPRVFICVDQPVATHPPSSSSCEARLHPSRMDGLAPRARLSRNHRCRVRPSREIRRVHTSQIRRVRPSGRSEACGLGRGLLPVRRASARPCLLVARRGHLPAATFIRVHGCAACGRVDLPSAIREHCIVRPSRTPSTTVVLTACPLALSARKIRAAVRLPVLCFRLSSRLLCFSRVAWSLRPHVRSFSAPLFEAVSK